MLIPCAPVGRGSHPVDLCDATAANPKTGEVVLVAAKATPHFKASKEMRERVEQSVKPEKSSLAG